MNRSDYIKAVAERAGFTQKDTRAVIDACEAVMTDVLRDGEEVKITSGINLSVRDVAARTARNPRTGEAIAVPAKKKIVAKFSKALKDAVN